MIISQGNDTPKLLKVLLIYTSELQKLNPSTKSNKPHEKILATDIPIMQCK